MGKSFKLLLHLVVVFALTAFTTVPGGLARERERTPALAGEVQAWLEEGKLRLQIELEETSEKAVLRVSQGEREASRTYRGEKRISATVEPVSAEPFLVALETDAPATEEYRWEIPLPSGFKALAKRLTLKRAAWEKKLPQKAERLEVTLSNQQKEDSGADEQRQSELPLLERWASEFYERFDREEKPEESELQTFRTIFEMEPNDTFEKADWLFDRKDAFGKLKQRGDVDYWKIRAPRDGVMEIVLQDIPAGENYDLCVYDAQKRELGCSEQSGNADEHLEAIPVKNREWYYVLVKGKGNSFNKNQYYRLSAEVRTSAAAGNADSFEPNDTFAKAFDLGNGQAWNEQTLEASLHSRSDTDVYRFSIALASTLEIKLEGVPEGMDIDLSLLDGNGKTLKKSNKPKNADEEIVWNADPGTYGILVAAGKNSGFAENRYKLSVKVRTMPVLLIPGIGGTRLQKEEYGKASEIWLAAKKIIWGVNDPEHRRALALTPVMDGSTEVEPRTRGIRIYPEEADEGFRAIEFLSYEYPELSEQYHSMVQALEKEGYRKAKTLFAVPYDWRYSNENNARQLKERIDLALKRSGAQQVQLVAHSMGGLLVRETLLSHASFQPKVRRVIYMGTPFLGSPRAYQALRLGYDFGIPFLDEDTGRIIAEYSPAVYELLPSRKFHSLSPFLLDVHFTRKYSYADLQLNRQLRVPYVPLLKQAIKLHDKWENQTIPGVQQFSIVGTGQSTLLGYKYEGLMNQFVPFYDDSEGDGTVPFVSADYAQKDITRKFYATVSHASMPSSPKIIAQVIQLLKGVEKAEKGLSKSAKKEYDYLYYMMMREDGGFPAVTIRKDGEELTIQPDKKEWREDLRIEKHGNIVVIHVLDKEPLDLFLPPGERGNVKVRVFSSQFSGEEKKNGREYLLTEAGLVEVNNSRE